MIKSNQSLPKSPFSFLFEAPNEKDEELLGYEFYIESKVSENTDDEREERFIFMPTISVCIIADKFNEAGFRTTIDSIKASTYSRFEIIVAINDEEKRVKLDDENIRLVCGKESTKNFMKRVREAVSGEFILILKPYDILDKSAFYHVVKALSKRISADAIYSDSDTYNKKGRFAPLFKPNFSPDTLKSLNFIGFPFWVSTRAYDAAKGYLYNDYDYVLRVANVAKSILHVPGILLSRIDVKENENNGEERSVIDAALVAENKRAHTVNGMYRGSYRVRYAIKSAIKASIVIAADDNVKALRRCLESIEDVTLFDNYKLIIAADAKSSSISKRYYSALTNGRAAKVVYCENAAVPSMLNIGVKEADGDIFVFLSPHTEPITPEWLNAIAELALQPHIGAVGGKLKTPTNMLVSCGTVVGLNGQFGFPYSGAYDAIGGHYMNFYTNTIRNVSAVRYECMAIERDVFNLAGGFDESFETLGFDTDICLRILNKRLYNVYTPYAVAFIHEDEIKAEELSEKNMLRLEDTLRDFKKSGDPYFNVNFSTEKTILQLKER
ncbi:MAG: glycosyltransferase [Clostridia bacterium]